MIVSIHRISNTPFKIKTWLSIWLSFMLLLVSMLHATELNTAHYRHQNELVLIEFTSLFIVILLGVSNFISSFYYLINHNSQYLRQSLTCFLITIGSFILAILVDSETLLRLV